MPGTFTDGISATLRLNTAPFKAGINEAKAAVRQYGQTVKDINKGVSAGFKETDWNLRALKTPLRDVGVEAKKTGEHVQGMGHMMRRAVEVVVAYKLYGWFRQAMGAGIAFGEAMGQVATVVDTNRVSIPKLREEIKLLSIEMGTNLIENARAMQFALSSGIKPEGIVEFMTVVNKAAKAGGSSVEAAQVAITGALNAYKLSTKDATRVADVFFKTVDRGIITFSQLAGEVGVLTPLGSQLGVSLEELSAMLAALTLSGLSASESATQMRAAMISLIEPSDEAKKLLQEHGIVINAAAIAQNGFAKTLADLEARFKGNTAALKTIFPNIRAFQGILAVTGNQAEQFRDILKQMENGAGALGRAYEKAMKEPSGQIIVLQETISTGFTTVGDTIVETLARIATSSNNVQESALQLSIFFLDFRMGLTYLSEWVGIFLDGLKSIWVEIKTLAKGTKQVFTGDWAGIAETLNKGEKEMAQIGDNTLARQVKWANALERIAKEGANLEKRLEDLKAGVVVESEKTKQDAIKKTAEVTEYTVTQSLEDVEKLYKSVTANVERLSDVLARAEEKRKANVERVSEFITDRENKLKDTQVKGWGQAEETVQSYVEAMKKNATTQADINRLVKSFGDTQQIELAEAKEAVEALSDSFLKLGEDIKFTKAEANLSARELAAKTAWEVKSIKAREDLSNKQKKALIAEKEQMAGFSRDRLKLNALEKVGEKKREQDKGMKEQADAANRVLVITTALEAGQKKIAAAAAEATEALSKKLDFTGMEADDISRIVTGRNNEVVALQEALSLEKELLETLNQRKLALQTTKMVEEANPEPTTITPAEVKKFQKRMQWPGGGDMPTVAAEKERNRLLSLPQGNRMGQPAPQAGRNRLADRGQDLNRKEGDEIQDNSVTINGPVNLSMTSTGDAETDVRELAKQFELMAKRGQSRLATKQ